MARLFMASTAYVHIAQPDKPMWRLINISFNILNCCKP